MGFDLCSWYGEMELDRGHRAGKYAHSDSHKGILKRWPVRLFVCCLQGFGLRRGAGRGTGSTGEHLTQELPVHGRDGRGKRDSGLEGLRTKEEIALEAV